MGVKNYCIAGSSLFMCCRKPCLLACYQGFLQHINSVDPAIKFTVEDNKEDGSIPFLDTVVKPEVDDSLSITVYRKPPHTD